MKIKTLVLLIAVTLMSCTDKKPDVSITGTWKLITGTLIENGDTVVTGYTNNVSFIKIINNTHFAFIHHDLNRGADSAALFSAGAGSYTLTDNVYTEHLEYCTAREWEGNDFSFTVHVTADSLIQTGIEKIESLGVNRLNIEKYVRIAE